MRSYDTLKPQHRDMLFEIGSICGGSSATSLFSLIYEKVAIDVHLVSLRGYKQLINSISNDTEVMVSHLGNDINGLFGFCFTKPSAHELINMILGGCSVSVETDKYNELIDSMKIELGNILCASFVTAYASLIPSSKARVTYTTPVIIHNGHDLRSQTIHMWQHSSHVFIQIILKSDSFKGSIFFFQDYLSFDFLLKVLSQKDYRLSERC